MAKSSRRTAQGDQEAPASYPPLGWAGPVSITPMPIVFGVLGILAGGSAWVVSRTAGGQASQALRNWGGATFAAFFSLFGLRFVLEGVNAPRRWQLRNFQGGTEPWGEGYRWRQSMPPLTPEGAGWFKGCIGVLALGSFGALINLVWFDLGALRGSPLLAYVLVPLFTLFVLFVLVTAAREVGRQLLFGSSKLELETWPVAPGGRLRAILRSRDALAPSGRASATLSLLEQTPPVMDGRSVIEPPRVTVAHSQRCRIDVAKAALGKRSLRIEIDIPPGQPGTSLRRPDGGRRYWVLDLSVPTRGILDRRESRFLVPIYLPSDPADRPATP